MPETGLEPALPEGNQPLKLARLPIPPLRHKHKEDRGSKIEDREISRLFVDPQSSILNLRSSIFDFDLTATTSAQQVLFLLHAFHFA